MCIVSICVAGCFSDITTQTHPPYYYSRIWDCAVKMAQPVLESSGLSEEDDVDPCEVIREHIGSIINVLKMDLIT